MRLRRHDGCSTVGLHRWDWSSNLLPGGRYNYSVPFAVHYFYAAVCAGGAFPALHDDHLQTFDIKHLC